MDLGEKDIGDQDRLLDEKPSPPLILVHLALVEPTCSLEAIVVRVVPPTAEIEPELPRVIHVVSPELLPDELLTRILVAFGDQYVLRRPPLAGAVKTQL